MKRIGMYLIVLPFVAVAAVAAWLWQAGKDYEAWPCMYGEEES